MRATIIRLQDGVAIRLPEALAKALAPDQTEVELEQGEGKLFISPPTHPRQGWAESVQANPPGPEDNDGWLDLPNAFDEKEWAW